MFKVTDSEWTLYADCNSEQEANEYVRDNNDADFKIIKFWLDNTK